MSVASLLVRCLLNCARSPLRRILGRLLFIDRSCLLSASRGWIVFFASVGLKVLRRTAATLSIPELNAMMPRRRRERSFIGLGYDKHSVRFCDISYKRRPLFFLNLHHNLVSPMPRWTPWWIVSCKAHRGEHSDACFGENTGKLFLLFLYIPFRKPPRKL